MVISRYRNVFIIYCFFRPLASILGRFATLREMCDARVFQAYELEDESYAHSTRATNCEEHRVNTELSLDLKIDSVFWVSNEDIGIVFY